MRTEPASVLKGASLLFDLSDIKSINIDYYRLTAILTNTSGNPIAESEIPAMLIQAIEQNIPVRAVDSAVGITYRLLRKAGKFELAQEVPISKS
jgi:hypothetical protein